MDRRTRARAAATGMAAAAVLALAAVGPAETASAAARPLPFFYDLYTFRGTADSTVILAAYAVPASSLEREQVGRQARYRFDVTLVLADTAAGTVFRTDDSVYVRLPRTPNRRHLLTTHIPVQTPPSATVHQHLIVTDATTPGIGNLYTARVPIPDYSGPNLMLSDVVLTVPGARHGWRRGDAILAFLPTGEFPRSAFDVYYEIYNLPQGREYITEIAVRRTRDDRGRPVEEDPVRVRYSGRSLARGDHTQPELRFVDAAVQEGLYQIIVTVTDQESGETAVRSRAFRVSGSAPEATLVTAIPRRAPNRPLR
jgi:hypothetical protein